MRSVKITTRVTIREGDGIWTSSFLLPSREFNGAYIQNWEVWGQALFHKIRVFCFFPHFGYSHSLPHVCNVLQGPTGHSKSFSSLASFQLLMRISILLRFLTLSAAARNLPLREVHFPIKGGKILIRLLSSQLVRLFNIDMHRCIRTCY